MNGNHQNDGELRNVAHSAGPDQPSVGDLSGNTAQIRAHSNGRATPAPRSSPSPNWQSPDIHRKISC
ncbi:MAG: hypothetical protein R2849_03810 [Thermomicrobiales bacterium]